MNRIRYHKSNATWDKVRLGFTQSRARALRRDAITANSIRVSRRVSKALQSYQHHGELHSTSIHALLESARDGFAVLCGESLHCFIRPQAALNRTQSNRLTEQSIKELREVNNWQPGSAMRLCHAKCSVFAGPLILAMHGALLPRHSHPPMPSACSVSVVTWKFQIPPCRCLI